ncbi:MAG: TetR/AcrR family transcriptional regulator [Ruminococcaceae bacterium]|nr:TetR/AcrR family transcriptional regulator [Oscillospiraceae bacterium]MBR3596859.1 TetR/AcrR family transcriptional regulator [Clostridia bacterium]
MQNSVELKLRKAMAELADKNVEKISVLALCEKAGISRASFYLYYKDIDELIVKTREYIINKFDEQLNIILNIKDGVCTDKSHIVFTEEDLALLKAFTGKHVYWDFAVDANNIIAPRYKKKMIERWGEDYYNENKEIFEFILNGGVATLYIDLLNHDKETYIKNMHRISDIANELLL